MKSAAPRFPIRWAVPLAAIGAGLNPCLPAAGPDPAAEPVPVTRLVVEGWRHRVWVAYPVEKIKADEDLPLQPRAEGVHLAAAQDEHEPLVLVLRTEMPLREVEVAVTGLKGPGGALLPERAFSTRRIGYVYVDEPSGTRIRDPMPYRTGTGWYPDPLLNGSGQARPGRNLQFWVSVHVPATAAPGRYEGQLEIRYRNESWMPPGKLPAPIRVPLVLNVRKFALPQTSPLRNTAVFKPALPHGLSADPEWLAGFYAGFVAHRQTPEPVLPSPVVKLNREGGLEVDATGWEQAAARLFDELRLPHIFVPVWSYSPQSPMQGIYFLWHYPMITRQRWQGAFICGEDRQLTPEFKQRFGAYLSAIDAIVQRRGWTGRVFVTTMDEPYTFHTGDRQRDIPENNYQVVRNYVDFVRRTAPHLRTFVTADPVPELTGLVDHWCLRNLKFAAAARERATAHGETFTFCDNYRTFIDFPAVGPRSLGWLAWQLGAQGWLTYETMGGLDRAWEAPLTVLPQFNGQLLWGMGQMFYPDPVGADLLPSLRWELMREGCEDYEYLWLLRERWKALPPERRSGTGAGQIQALLESAAEAVVGGTGDPETASTTPHARPNAQSNRVPHELRERIAGWIETLPEPARP